MIQHLATKPVYVLAGTYEQAKDFARERGMGENELVYVEDEHKLMGVERYSVLFLTGTWDRRANIVSILNTAMSRGLTLLEHLK